MKDLYRSKLACCFFLCAVTAEPVHAVVFKGKATGSFGNVMSGAGDYTAVKNHDAGPLYWYSSTFEWGTVATKESCINGQCQNVPIPQTGSSLFAFDGIGSDAGESGYSAPLGQAFSLGSFKYLNLPTHHSSGVTGVDFTVNASFQGLGLNTPFTYHFAIDNTNNVPNNVADTATLTGQPGAFNFTSGGQAYTFSLLGFSTNGGSDFQSSFVVNEGQFVKANLYGRFDAASASNPTSVPVPAAWGLLSLGLLGFSTLAHKAGKRS